MSVEKVIGIGLVAAALIVAVVGVILTPRWQVSQTAVIAAKPRRVLAYLANWRHWSQWSVWNRQHYPDTRFSFGGPAAGQGAQMTWDDGTNRTVWRITGYQPGRVIRYRRRTGDGRLHYGRFTASLRKGKTRLQWQMWGSTGINPFSRVMVQFLLARIRGRMSRGLAGLQCHFAAGVKARGCQQP